MSARGPSSTAVPSGDAVPWGEFGGREGGWGEVARWLVAVLLAVALALALGALSASQATSEEVATPALERALASLSEIDALIALHEPELAEAARAAAATGGGEVALPGFPLAVTVPASEVQSSSGGVDRVRVRAALLSAGAERLRAEGVAAFHDPGGAPIETTATSSAGLMRRVIDELRASRHDRWAGLVLPLLVVAVALGAVLAWLARGPARFAYAGGAVLGAGLLVVLGTLVLRLGLGLALLGGDDPVGEEGRAIAGDLLAAHLRNGLVAAGAGVALLVPAVVLRMVEERTPRGRSAVPLAPRER